MNHPARTFPALALKSLALAALLTMQAQAIAATPTSDELNSVKLYGDVTIAQDSTSSWGPWTQFEAPAAGPGVLAVQRVNAEPFRSLPKANFREDMIGFGAFTTLTVTFDADDNSTRTSDGPHPLSLVATALQPSSSNSIFPDAIHVKTTPLATGLYTQPSSDRLTLQEGGYANGVAGQDQTSLILFPSALIDAEAAQVGVYVKSIVQYISSPEERSQRVTQETGVIGYKTPVNDIAALGLDGAKATYNGYAINDGGNAPVILNVDFGKATWNGSWNGGTNTVNEGGNTAVGFTAQGNIKGALFNSTSVAATDANSIRGTVQGAFFGPAAAAAGGVADVTKDGARYVAPFLTVKQAPIVQKVDGPK